jgi:hypothetical protein
MAGSRLPWLRDHAQEIGFAVLPEVRRNGSTYIDAREVGLAAVAAVEKVISGHVCEKGHRYHVLANANRPRLYCRRCGNVREVRGDFRSGVSV